MIDTRRRKVYELVASIRQLYMQETGAERDVNFSDEMKADFRWWMESARIGKVILTLDKGHFGLVVGTALAGDKIFFLNSSRVPWILRPDDTPSNTSTSGSQVDYHRMIGWAYVHGIMNGEAMPMIRSGEKPMMDVFIT